MERHEVDDVLPELPTGGAVGTRELWAYARVEGFYTTAQMRKFLSAGILRPGRTLLYRRVEGVGEADGDLDKAADAAVREPASWHPFVEVFPSPDDAFAPTASGDDGGEGPAVLDAATIKAKRAWARNFFALSQRWYYVDQEGKRRGPYSGSLMGAWFGRGYFWDGSLLLACSGWTSWAKLSDILAMEDADIEGDDDAGGGAATAGDHHAGGAASGGGGAADESPADADAWEYKDLEGTVQGPFEDGKMRGWVAAGYFPADTPCRAVGSDGARHEWSTVGRVFPASREAASAASSASASASSASTSSHGAAAASSAAASPAHRDVPAGGWYYRDLNGVVQGPFTAAQIASWRGKGYFPDATPCRHEDDSDDDWSTMGDVFPLPSH